MASNDKGGNSCTCLWHCQLKTESFREKHGVSFSYHLVSLSADVTLVHLVDSINPPNTVVAQWIKRFSSLQRITSVEIRDYKRGRCGNLSPMTAMNHFGPSLMPYLSIKRECIRESVRQRRRFIFFFIFSSCPLPSFSISLSLWPFIDQRDDHIVVIS